MQNATSNGYTADENAVNAYEAAEALRLQPEQDAAYLVACDIADTDGEAY